MLLRLTISTLLILFSFSCFAQSDHSDRVYDFTWKKDGIILSAGAVGWMSSSYVKSRSAEVTSKDVRKLSALNVWAFDRSAINNNSIAAQKLSDKFLYAGFALPFLTYLDPKVRNEKGAVFGMAIETFLINGAITDLFKSSAKRYRPYVYNESGITEAGINSTSRESFLSGHTSHVAAASFFTAQVLTDLHPDSDWKPVIWAAAALAPAVTGYLRYKAGKHFPTDVIAGYSLGALVGYLVPKWHRIKVKEDVNLNIGSVSEGVGLSLTFNLK